MGLKHMEENNKQWRTDMSVNKRVGQYGKNIRARPPLQDDEIPNGDVKCFAFMDGLITTSFIGQ